MGNTFQCEKQRKFHNKVNLDKPEMRPEMTIEKLSSCHLVYNINCYNRK